jgi:hypothetical protein
MFSREKIAALTRHCERARLCVKVCLSKYVFFSTNLSPGNFSTKSVLGRKI